MRRCLSRPLILFVAVFLGGGSLASALPTTLFLLNGTVVRGEIVERSPRIIQVQTVSGLVKVKTATLMPISRQQLKLPAETGDPDLDVVIAQMEKLVVENEALQVQIAGLKAQIAKTGKPPAEPVAPGEGPKAPQ